MRSFLSCLVQNWYVIPWYVIPLSAPLISAWLYFLISTAKLHPFLEGPSQFIIASINALITVNSLRALLDLDKMIKEGKLTRFLARFHWVTSATGFLLVVIATPLAVARIIMRAQFPFDTPPADLPKMFAGLDTTIVFLMGWGYFLMSLSVLKSLFFPPSKPSKIQE